MLAPRPQEDADGAAQRAAVPDEPAAREQVAEHVVGGGVPVLGQPPQAGADDPADQGDEDHLVRPVDGLAELLEAQAEQDPGRHEAEAHHQPEGLQGEAEDVELGLHCL